MAKKQEHIGTIVRKKIGPRSLCPLTQRDGMIGSRPSITRGEQMC